MGFFAGLRKHEQSTTSLGAGISGKVELHKNSKECYVTKTYHCKDLYETKKEYKARVLNEYYILSAIDHRNFVKVFKFQISLDGLKVRVQMEAGSQDLSYLMKKAGSKLRTNDILCLWKQVCSGVSYLHNKGLCHRDLKLENLVMDRSFTTVKIIDLVTATDCNSPAFGIVGSARYMAPEMSSKISYEGRNVDIWSLGIILYYMIRGKFPWLQALHTDEKYAAYATSRTRLINTKVDVVMDSRPSSLVLQVDLPKLPPPAIILLSQMLEVDPGIRCDIGEICGDNWFDSVRYCSTTSECQHSSAFERVHAPE